MGLASFLKEEPEGPSFHVDGLWPYEGHLLLVAPAKWGKSTLVRNLVDSAVTGSDFLGEFKVTSPFKRVLILDMELTPHQLWNYWTGPPLTDEQAQFDMLRGSSGSMVLRDPRSRRDLAARIRDTGADLVVVDPLGPVMRVNEFEENSNDDVGRMMDLWKEVCSAAGVTASVLPHHTGHGGERGRGASVFNDTADAIWTGTYSKPGENEGPRSSARAAETPRWSRGSWSTTRPRGCCRWERRAGPRRRRTGRRRPPSRRRTPGSCR